MAVTVAFAEVVDPTRCVEFSTFDGIIKAHGCTRIRSIGDGYLFVRGMPADNPLHAQRALAAAQEILAWVRDRKDDGSPPPQIRIGLHSGPLMGGVAGEEGDAGGGHADVLRRCVLACLQSVRGETGDEGVHAPRSPRP
jgi:class 3 adenylate cyclase